MSRGASRTRPGSPTIELRPSAAFEPRQLAEQRGRHAAARRRRCPSRGRPSTRGASSPATPSSRCPASSTDGHRFLEAAVAAGAAALVVSEAARRGPARRAGRPTRPAERRPRGRPGARPCGPWRPPTAPASTRSSSASPARWPRPPPRSSTAEVLAGRFQRAAQRRQREQRDRPAADAAAPAPRARGGRPRDGPLHAWARSPSWPAWRSPSIGVVTAVRGVHLSRAGSIEAIEAGKRELVEALPASGWAVLNADDPRVSAHGRPTPARVLRYGFDAGRRRARRGRPLAGGRGHALPAAPARRAPAR